VRFEGHFTRGRLNGASTAWHENGKKEVEENRLDGQLHGRVRYWSEKGDLQFDSTFDYGMNQHRRNVSYRYLSYLPKDYEANAARKWPLVIYLHGGSDRCFERVREEERTTWTATASARFMAKRARVRRTATGGRIS
jgi:poly(3-hydroxybutyrate) depolymerase